MKIKKEEVMFEVQRRRRKARRIGLDVDEQEHELCDGFYQPLLGLNLVNGPNQKGLIIFNT